MLFRSCIGNLVHQTLEDIEILFVDDCSTDSSLQLLRECQRQYPEKVRVIASPDNRRAGGARNLALDIATGEYIGFVDCDDLPDLQMFEKLYQRAAETGSDMVDGGFIYDGQDSIVLYTSDETTGRQTPAKRKQLIITGGYLWSKLIRRELIERYHLRFREHIPMLEDADFLDMIWSVADTIENVKEVIYRYKNTEGSLSKKRDRDSYFNSLYEAMNAIYEKEHRLSIYPKIKEALEYEMLQMYSSAVNACLESHLAGEDYPALEWLEKFRKLRKRTAVAGYENKYVMEKLPVLDRAIMQMNDENPKKLMGAAKGMKWEFESHR